MLKYLHNVNIDEPRYKCLVCRHVNTYDLYGIHITHADDDDESVEEEEINDRSSTGLREITPSYILHTRAFGTYLLGGLFTLQKRL
jgi:hypothetical protein